MFKRRFAGSYPGEPIVSAWATMLYLGNDGYKSNAKAIVKLANHIRTFVRENIPSLRIMGDPRLMVTAFQSVDESKMEILRVYSEMGKKGWNLNGLPTGFHLCVTQIHVQTERFAEHFLSDLTASVDIVKNNPQVKPTGTASIYCSAQLYPAETIARGGQEYLNALADVRR